jgi:hypothetical protein
MLLLIAQLSFFSSQSFPQTKAWNDTSYYNSGVDQWTLEITSTEPNRMSCTFTIDGFAPIGNGPTTHQIHQQIGLVVPGYSGSGAAIVAHTDAPAHISSFRKTVTCSS